MQSKSSQKNWIPCKECGCQRNEKSYKDKLHITIDNDSQVQMWDYIWPGKMNYFLCNYCSLIYLKNKPSSNQIQKHYNTDNLFSKGLLFRIKLLIKNKRDLYLIKYLNKNKKYKKILEIGCAEGSLIYKLKKIYKCETYGYEYNQQIKELGKKLFKTNYLDNINSQKFDLIIMSHVLEHFLDIKKEINNLKKLLNQKGELLIEVPNINKKEFATDLNVYRSLYETDHIYNFNKDSIKRIFMNNNFKISKIQRIIYNLDTKNYLKLSKLLIISDINLNTIFNYIKLFVKFIIFNFPIYKNIKFDNNFYGYGDNLILIAKKND